MAPRNGMACGERIVRCLIGEPVDRVPFGVGLGWSPWSQTRERWRQESGNADLEEWKEFGFDSDFALPEVNYGISPDFEQELISENEELVVVRDERGVTARHRRDGASMPQFPLILCKQRRLTARQTSRYAADCRFARPP